MVVLDSGKSSRGGSLLKPLLKNGKMVAGFDSIDNLRAKVRKDLDDLRTSTPSLQWR
jgi:hypothetical protein